MQLGVVAIWLIAWAVISFGGHGHPRPEDDPDGSILEWSLRQKNMDDSGCCGLGDEYVLTDDEWRHGKDGYEVLIGGVWHKVLPGHMRDTSGGPNPTGHAIAWYREYAPDIVTIYCFAPGTEY